MTTSFQLGPAFFERLDVPLSLPDLKYGFERGWLRPSSVVAIAMREVARGGDDAALTAVASLLGDELDDLPELLERVDSPNDSDDPGMAARKWLFFQLQAAFDRREDLADPLGVVEQIYADFDYPPAGARLVRYMPPQAGEDPAGEAALVDRWASFLHGEQAKLPSTGWPR